MKNLNRLFAVVLSLGMLGTAACTSCEDPEEEPTSTTSQPRSYQCGAGTTRVGNQCVGNTTSRNNSQPTSTLSTTGNN
jgi:hypothetical protein